MSIRRGILGGLAIAGATAIVGVPAWKEGFKPSGLQTDLFKEELFRKFENKEIQPVVISLDSYVAQREPVVHADPDLHANTARLIVSDSVGVGPIARLDFAAKLPLELSAPGKVRQAYLVDLQEKPLGFAFDQGYPFFRHADLVIGGEQQSVWRVNLNVTPSIIHLIREKGIVLYVTEESSENRYGIAKLEKAEPLGKFAFFPNLQKA